MKRGFTLIELLVVIAIIAILAAILFPVFAQAKFAAKKTVTISNLKQTATAVTMYTNDYDDNYPIASSHSTAWGWGTAYGYVDVPGDWFNYSSAYGVDNNDIHQAMMTSWANSVYPYMKSWDVMHSAFEKVVDWPNFDTLPYVLKPYNHGNFGMNGLLSEYSATAVTSPSQLPLVFPSMGALSCNGEAWVGPVLNCGTDADCRYQPANEETDTCASGNGGYSWFAIPDTGDYWTSTFEKDISPMGDTGLEVAFADTSAKWRPVGRQLGSQNTNYKVDFWTDYQPNGSAAEEWDEQAGCHPLQFRPDFDFQNWGNPIAQ